MNTTGGGETRKTFHYKINSRCGYNNYHFVVYTSEPYKCYRLCCYNINGCNDCFHAAMSFDFTKTLLPLTG